MKHTKGPWDISALLDYSYGEGNPEALIFVKPNVEGTMQDRILMNAAPELLEALWVVVNHLKDKEQHTNLVKMLLKTIAKSEGKE